MGFSRIMMIVLFVLSFASLAHADPPLPESDWTEEAQHNLARCWVGEAGWGHEVDHAAIGWALVRRLEFLRVRNPRLSFARLAEQYCQALATPRPSQRQLWVRALPWGDLVARNRASTFPAHLSWTGHNERWRVVRERVAAFGRGELEEVCPGATDWGGPMDSIPERATLVCERRQARAGETEATLNTFYFIDREARRAMVRDRVRARERARVRPVGGGAIPASIARGRGF